MEKNGFTKKKLCTKKGVGKLRFGSVDFTETTKPTETYRKLPKLPSRTEPIVSVRFGRFGSVSVHFGRSQSQMKGLVILHSKAQ